MDPIYIVVITVLMALAVSDLVVGVSNDAVNFLNSAIGSKAAPRWVIMTVASIGILIGAIFSSGMMEVARSGIFYPGQFDFHSVMMIFLAVMITDVILLDMFNTLGLPTSTTVSLVFELLGSAVAVALVTMWSKEGGSADTLANYINSSKAMAIISGILISVVISFTVGAIVMFITRILFSFKYKTSFKYVGALWCGVALTAISYFAIFKGLKGSSIMSSELVSWIDATGTTLIVLGSFAFWTMLMWLLQFIFRLNILKLTILAGTLALALAFAGNDLVNFIGVSMAGWSSLEIAQSTVAAGGDIATLKMGALAQKVEVEWIYLFIAGAVMTITLWFSKKARHVTDTEINLASQDSGDERFGSTLVSRALVRSATKFNKAFTKITPSPVQRWVEKRFEPVAYAESEKASFDHIRATVNLTCAAILIAMATSLKLPLSTTYVTFMVAMGTSLADRAWGRESAVYRITGVLTVISGWFLTALIAFTVAFIVAMVLMYGGDWAIYGMSALCVLILIQSRITYKKRQSKKSLTVEEEGIEALSTVDKLRAYVCDAMASISDIYDSTIQGLQEENIKKLKKSYKKSKEFREQIKQRKSKMYISLYAFEAQDINTGHYYVQTIDYLNEVAKALLHITEPSLEYIENNHQCFSNAQIDDLKVISSTMQELYGSKSVALKNGESIDVVKAKEQREALFNDIEKMVKRQVERVIAGESSTRGSVLYLNILSESKTMALQSGNMLKSHNRFLENNL